MTFFLLVRHGHNDWMSKKRLAGWTPGIHLNDDGQKQVARLAKRLAKLPIKAVYSSPLERCMETAAAVARSHDLDVIELEAVGEVRYGRWEGQKLKKLAANKPEWYAVQHYPSRFRFPQGESLREVQQRAVAALEELSGRHPKDVVVVVSHADVIRLILAHYLGVHIDLFQRIGLSPVSVSALSLSPGGSVRVLRINDDGPMLPPSKPKRKAKSPSAGQRRKRRQKQVTAAVEPAEAEPEAEVAETRPPAEPDLVQEAEPS